MERSLTFVFWIFIFISVHQNLNAQYKDRDFSALDTWSRGLHCTGCTTQELADTITQHVGTELERVRALYIWITQHIAYDIDVLDMDVVEKSESCSADQVVKKRKTVCHGYSNLFLDVSLKMGLYADFAGGYSKNIKDRVSRSRHAWNLVKVDNRWYGIDATWGSGYLDENEKFHRKLNEQFFLADPNFMILTHFPLKEVHQLLSCPISLDEFKKNNKTELAALLDKPCNRKYVLAEAVAGLNNEIKVIVDNQAAFQKFVKNYTKFNQVVMEYKQLLDKKKTPQRELKLKTEAMISHYEESMNAYDQLTQEGKNAPDIKKKYDHIYKAIGYIKQEKSKYQ